MGNHYRRRKVRIKIINIKKWSPILHFRRGARENWHPTFSCCCCFSYTCPHLHTPCKQLHQADGYVPHLFPAPFRELFLTHLQGRGCAFILCLQSPQHNEAGPLGTIMTINNHNSGVGCFQIPDSHSSKLPSTHKQPPHTLLPLWMWPLLLFRAETLCSCRL